MTIGELCIILEHLPADMRVVVNGYEGGYDDVVNEEIREITLALNVNKDSCYFGPHDEAIGTTEHETCKALLIGRVS